jgi:hypothetical protein
MFGGGSESSGALRIDLRNNTLMIFAPFQSTTNLLE